MIKLSRYSDVFPYEKFRSEQEGIVALIEESTHLKKIFLLSAHNDTGKTLIVLSVVFPVAIEQGLKIIYICRKHAQSARLTEELRRISKISPLNSNHISGLSNKRG